MAPRKSDTKSKAPKAAKPTAPAKSAKGTTRPKATAGGGKTGVSPVKPPAAVKPARAARVAAKPAAKAAAGNSGAAKAPAAKPARAAGRTPPPSPPSPRSAEPPQGPVYSQGDRDRFERILLDVRGRLLKEMGHLEDTVLNRSLRDSSGELSGYSFHMADIGTDAMEREKAFLFASAEGRALLDINEALRRLYNGEYGNCEVCGDPISTARLEVVPQARMCVRCKQEEERGQPGRNR